MRWIWLILAVISYLVLDGWSAGLQYVLPIAFVIAAIASKSSKKIGEPRREPQLGSKYPRPTELSMKLLRAMDWKLLEEVCAEYFRMIGFHAVTQTHGPDGGVDITLYSKDDHNQIYAIVQCKQRSNPMGPKAMRELLGVMTDRKVSNGVFVTTSYFNEEATRLASENRIDLISGMFLLKQINALTTKQQQRLLQIATEGDYLTPTCANCGIKLAIRENRRNKSQFWGCRNYPRCRMIINI